MVGTESLLSRALVVTFQKVLAPYDVSAIVPPNQDPIYVNSKIPRMSRSTAKACPLPVAASLGFELSARAKPKLDRRHEFILATRATPQSK